jgi:hypothetical protein
MMSFSPGRVNGRGLTCTMPFARLLLGLESEASLVNSEVAIMERLNGGLTLRVTVTEEPGSIVPRLQLIKTVPAQAPCVARALTTEIGAENVVDKVTFAADAGPALFTVAEKVIIPPTGTGSAA